ncbi:MAG: hypothetical protein ABIP48_30960, partial [Planctomycetota bacterium]
RDGSRSHGVWRLDPVSGDAEVVFDDPHYHDVQAKCIYPRQEPDGRSSVVTEEDPHGRLYCLNVYTSDLEGANRMAPGSVQRVRVLEGVPLARVAGSGFAVQGSEFAQTRGTQGPEPRTLNPEPDGIPPLAQRRILGEIPVGADGSFNVEIPANTPIEVQILDADGMALRSCGWIWAKNREPRGCVGCHEDGEMVPENWFVDAVAEASVNLTPPPGERRSIDFRRDVMPIFAAKCVECHGREEKTPLYLADDLSRGGARRGATGVSPGATGVSPGATGVSPGATGVSPVPGEHGQDDRGARQSYENLLTPAAEAGAMGKYVHPGRARTSPLVWHVFGRNTARPWDGVAQRESVKRMPPEEAAPLDEQERRTLVEWIDTGALWEGIAAGENTDG